jgi:hypothetical protein
MKRSLFEKELMTSLGPSLFSGSGFMGRDTRSLEEIVAEDLAFLKRKGVAKERLLAALEEAYDKAKSAFGATVEIRPGVTAVFHESMGRVPSPFPGEGVFEKGEAVVTEHKTGARLIITQLSLHLVEKHGFFQGAGSRYRIDPDRAIDMLGLA